MTASPRTLAGLVAAHLAASLLHLADNALRFGHYHDDATPWLNPTTVVAFWLAQTALGLAGLALHRRGKRVGWPMLLAYGALGFAGLLHYLAPLSHAMGVWMHALIVLEALTGAALLAGLAWRPSTPPAAGTNG